MPAFLFSCFLFFLLSLFLLPFFFCRLPAPLFIYSVCLFCAYFKGNIDIFPLKRIKGAGLCEWRLFSCGFGLCPFRNCCFLGLDWFFLGGYLFFLCLFCLFSCGNYFFFLMRADFHFFADGCHTPVSPVQLDFRGFGRCPFRFFGRCPFWNCWFFGVDWFFLGGYLFFLCLFCLFSCGSYFFLFQMRAKSHVLPISIATPYIRFPGCVSSEYPLMYPCFLYPSSIFVTVACTFPIFRFQLDAEA